ncbi:hypothetical protein PIB30_094124, partial [Stylosanthes scabra]|nr:hypothetical protein [Stylosanthes scabra]
MGFRPSAPTRGDDFLMPLRSLFRNSNGITSRFCLFLVYWNPEARECRITKLDPSETLAFQFLQSLPVGLGKKSNFKCRWILDHSDAEVGVLLDSLLRDMEKQSRYDRLLQKMVEHASGGSSSSPAVPVPAPTTSVPPAPSSSAAKTRGKPSDATAAKPFSVEREEGAKEDPVVDLRQKRRKQKVGVENTFAAKVQLEKELAATKDQVDVLTAETDSALAAPLLHAKIKSLSQEMERAEGERLSALDRMKEVEERAKVQAAELESCRSALEQERKK